MKTEFSLIEAEIVLLLQNLIGLLTSSQLRLQTNIKEMGWDPGTLEQKLQTKKGSFPILNCKNYS